MEPEVQTAPVNVDNTTPDSPALNIDTGTAPAAPPSDEVAKTRAYKAHMGLSDIIKQNYDEIYRNIADGNEDNLRKEAALNITTQATEDKQKAILNLAATKGSALTLDDLQHLDTQPADPKNVIEQAYSRAYLNTGKDAAARLPDNIISDAAAQDPDKVDAYFQAGSEVLGKREYALKTEQDLQPVVDSNNYFSFKLPSVQGMQDHSFSSHDVKQLATFGLYDEVKLRGLDNTSRFTGIGLGENLDNAIKGMLSEPTPVFQKKFDDIIDSLKQSEPELAQRFAHYVAGMASNDKYINDIMTAANLAIGGQAALGIKAGLKKAGQVQVDNLARSSAATDRGGLVQGPDGVYRAQAVTPTSSTEVTVTGPQAQAQAAKAVADIVKSANVPEVTKATIAEGAGDVHEAAVQKTVNSVIVRPDPEKDAIDTLLSLHRSDTQALTDNPGNLSREDHTRLLDAAAGFEKNAVSVLIDSSKVVRTPGLAEEGFRSILDKVKNYFPGRENTIADVQMRSMDVGQLTHHYDIRIVNYDGLPFSSYQLAENHARINGYDLSGIEGKTGEKVYLPEASVIKRGYQDWFKTAKGSQYTVHPDGTTTRNKASRPEHPGDVGLKPRSTSTKYITEDQFRAIQAKRKMPGTFKDDPEIGLMPVERWTSGPNKGKVHYGNPITEGGSTPKREARKIEVARHADGSFKIIGEDGVEIVPQAQPQPGYVPYNLTTNRFERQLSDETARIEQQGMGFHIVVTKPLNETESFVRDGLIGGNREKSVSNIDTPGVSKFGNALIGLIRNPYDTLSVAENENRAKTVFGQVKFLDLVKNEIKDIEDIYQGMLGDRNVLIEKPLSYTRMPTGANRTVAEQFTRALTASQTLADPKTGLPGYYMKTPAEIEHFWQTNFHRPVSIKEMSAYLAVGRLDHFDHILRNASQYMYKARLGVEKWSFTTSKDGQLLPSPTFEAAQIKKVHGSIDEVTLIHDADGSE